MTFLWNGTFYISNFQKELKASVLMTYIIWGSLFYWPKKKSVLEAKMDVL